MNCHPCCIYIEGRSFDVVDQMGILQLEQIGIWHPFTLADMDMGFQRQIGTNVPKQVFQLSVPNYEKLKKVALLPPAFFMLIHYDPSVRNSSF